MRASLRVFEQWHRVPSIKFTGSADRWAGHSSTPAPHPSAPADIVSSSSFLSSVLAAFKSAPSPSSSSSSSSPSTPSKAPTPSSHSAGTGGKKGPPADYEDEYLSPSRFWLGKLKLDEQELDAIMSGGASVRG